MPRIKLVELGCPGHFCAASSCHWRRHTRIGPYRISSVGDYFPMDGDERTEIGCGRYFETMVFKVTGDCPEDEGCGCGQADFSELDFEGYNTAGEAQAGHAAMAKKYLAKARKEAKDNA